MPSSLTVANNVLHYTCDSIAGGLTDTSGNSNTGTLQGSGTTLVSGQIGSAISFNGSGYVSFTSVAALGLPTQTSEFSASVWIKTSAVTAAIIEFRDPTAGILHFGIGYNGLNGNNGAPDVLLQASSGVGGVNTLLSTTPVNDNNWHHLVYTRNSSQLNTIYIDGVSNTSSTDSIGGGITPTLADANIGKDVLNGGITQIIGLLDDIQIYNRAITSTEVNSIYTAGIGGAQTYQITAPLAGSGAVVQPKLIDRMVGQSAWSGVGSIPLNTQITLAPVAHAYPISSPLAGAGLLAASLLSSPRITARLSGVGAGVFSLSSGRFLEISNIFAGGFVDPDTGLPYGTWHGQGKVKAILGRMLGIFAQFSGESNCEVLATWMQADFIWPGIVEKAGEMLLYRQAAGLEKALADVDGFRLTQTYVELIRDQWDPYRISSNNLPYLAWALGVNLWEDTWSEEFKRYWVANQWTMKYERGSAKGLNDFVNTVNASPGMHARDCEPDSSPACFYPGKALTEAERLAYVARFPQLRLYPYAPRPQAALPWLSWRLLADQERAEDICQEWSLPWTAVESITRPTSMPVVIICRSATLYEPQTGVETQLTVRTIVAAPQPGQKEITYDEISLSSIPGNLFYPGQNKQYLLSKHPIAQKLKHAVVLGRLPYTPDRLVRIPRDGTLERTQFQASVHYHRHWS